MTIELNGPAGINKWDNDQTLIANGMCWKDSNVITDEFQAIANCTVQTIDKYYNSSFMWTAHNQLEERWDYMRAWDLGYFAAKEMPSSGDGPMQAPENKSPFLY